MASVRISALLEPFLAAPLSSIQLKSISIYIDMLLRWNRKLSLTAVRDPDSVVTRHFGESLFAAQRLFLPSSPVPRLQLVDVGSGAGFPGLPIKICVPELSVILIEANHKKAAFLREVIRALTLKGVDVFLGRAEDFAPHSAGIVTMRAVERFERALPVAARLVRPGGLLALLIGESQVQTAAQVLPGFSWQASIPVPCSTARVLLVGRQPTPGLQTSES